MGTLARLGMVGFLLLHAASAAATSISADFSGQALPDDDTFFEPDVTVGFDWNESCTTGCTLTVTLTYNELVDPNTQNDQALSSFAQVLSGVTFDAVGTGFTVDKSSSSVSAEDLVGNGVDGGAGFPTSATTDVSGHYGYRGDLAVAGLGDHILSSVGDVTFNGVMNMGEIGTSDLLPGTTYTGVETQPPNGSYFGLLNDLTDPTLDQPFDQISGGVWIQNQATATLSYSGQLDDVTNILPLFGTDGVAIPEPGSALLLGAGLAGMAMRRRRSSRDPDSIERA